VKSLETIFPEPIQEYFRSISLLRLALDEQFQDFKIMELELILFDFHLKAGIEKVPVNIQKYLIN
jgi:hypothetical protein